MFKLHALTEENEGRTQKDNIEQESISGELR